LLDTVFCNKKKVREKAYIYHKVIMSDIIVVMDHVRLSDFHEIDVMIN